MKRRRAEFPPTPPEQLDALSRYSESDKERVKRAADEHGSAKLVALLNANRYQRPASSKQ